MAGKEHIPWWDEHEKRRAKKMAAIGKTQANQPFFRAMLYHKSCKDGKVFTDEVEYEEAVKSGWQDCPMHMKPVTAAVEKEEKPEKDKGKK